MAYSPLARNLLAGLEVAPPGANDSRRAHPRFAEENLAKNRALAQRVPCLWMVGGRGAQPFRL